MNALAILAIAAGSLPLIYMTWRLFRLDPEAFVVATGITMVTFFCLWLIFWGVGAA